MIGQKPGVQDWEIAEEKESAGQNQDLFRTGLCDGRLGRIIADLDREIYRDRGLGLYGLTVLNDWFEAPLADGLLSGGGQDYRSAHYTKVLDHPIGANQSL